MYSQLFSSLSASDTVLTVNRRLATYLREKYTQFQQQQGKTVWQSPDILPLTSWAERCWQEIQTTAQAKPLLLLNSNQELFLWQEIINVSSYGKDLLQPFATAQMAKSAWDLVKQWRIDFHSDDFLQTENSMVWQSWAKEFAATCQERNWLDQGSLLDYVTSALCSYKNARFFLVGFDEINPQQEHLLKTLQQRGCSYQIIASIVGEKKNINILPCADSDQELSQMARWAKQLWLNNPTTSIGCVVPNLSHIRARINTTFRKIFAPESLLPDHYNTALPFNISAGNSLKDFNIIQHALLALNLSEQTSLENLSILLRSPYLGYAEQEMTQRAELDVVLRTYGESNILLQQIIVAAKKNRCPQLAHLLQNYINTQRKVNTKLLPSQWRNYFLQQLSQLGWPGERTQESIEYQLHERWLKLLEEFAGYDLILDKITEHKALQLLNNAAATTLFQPKSNAVPIQVLGVLESAGVEFDHLWVMGLHDGVWPAAANPQPFIPKTIQHELQIPHSSNQREWEYAKKLTQRLGQCAHNSVFSYPQLDDDHKLQISPLLKQLTITNISEMSLAPYQPYEEIIFVARVTEEVEDANAPALLAHEKVLGGAKIFKYQAACPFQACARIRFNAQSIAEISAGLNAAERGSLMHLALEAFWNILQSQEKLLQLTTAELTAVLHEAINIALTQFTKNRPLTFKPKLIEIEKKRLLALLQDWLQHEKNRPTFTIAAIEKKQEFTVAGIPLNLRIDRIDQLADGSYFIIDYKTGKSSVDYWLGERPSDPQLPLYCIANPLPIQGLLFAQIRAGDMKFQGITAHTSQGKNIKSVAELKKLEGLNNWNDLLNYWRTTLENLGQQFQLGYAKPDPKDGAKTCDQCDLHLLCRYK